MTETTEAPAFSEWCILELMGHRRLAGLVTEQQIAGHGFLRLDVPGEGDAWSASQWYSPTSVYCITPTTEEIARKLAAGNRPRPAARWELEPVKPQPDDGEDEDEDEDDSSWR